MSDQAYMWNLPEWKKAPTVAQLQYGLGGVSFEDSWGWFWSDGHGVADYNLAADPWGLLWIRANTPLLCTAKSPGDYVGDPSCVWLESLRYARSLVVYLPPRKYAFLGQVGLDARQQGWYPVAATRGEAPPAALAGIGRAV